MTATCSMSDLFDGPIHTTHTMLLDTTNMSANRLDHDDSQFQDDHDTNEKMLLNDFFDMTQNNNDCDDNNKVSDDQLMMIQPNHVDVGFSCHQNLQTSNQHVSESMIVLASKQQPVVEVTQWENETLNQRPQGVAVDPSYIDSSDIVENLRQQQRHPLLDRPQSVPFLIPSTITAIQEKSWHVHENSTVASSSCSYYQYDGDTPTAKLLGGMVAGSLLDSAGTLSKRQSMNSFAPINDPKAQTKPMEVLSSQQDIGTINQCDPLALQQSILWQQMAQAWMMSQHQQQQQNQQQLLRQHNETQLGSIAPLNQSRQDAEQLYCNLNATIAKAHPTVCDSQTQVVQPTVMNNNLQGGCTHSITPESSNPNFYNLLELAKNMVQQQLFAITYQNGSNTSHSNNCSIPIGPTSGLHVDNSQSMVRDSVDAFAKAPLKSLSAYNFFFRDERERILSGESSVNECNDSDIMIDSSLEHQEFLLKQHWHQDREKKKHRRHRKTHGKISFTTLSKVISRRWKILSEEKKAFYRSVAAIDWDRYQREVNENHMASIQSSSLLYASSSIQVTPSDTPQSNHATAPQAAVNLNNLVFLPLMTPFTLNGISGNKNNDLLEQSHAAVVG